MRQVLIPQPRKGQREVIPKTLLGPRGGGYLDFQSFRRCCYALRNTFQSSSVHDLLLRVTEHVVETVQYLDGQKMQLGSKM